MIDPSCPWGSWPQLPPAFCEQPICSWVREPANTWSNVGFIVVGIVLFLATRAPARRHLRSVAWITLLTGAGSAFFHASETLPGVVFDYAGMTFGMLFMLHVCGLRMGMARLPLNAGLAAVFVVTLATLLFTEKAVRVVYAFEGLVCAASELWMFLRGPRAESYRYSLLFWAIFIPAFVAWTLDSTGAVCNPANHVFNGHAAWHLLDAVSFWFLFRYYEQFEILRRGMDRGRAPAG